jgi:hypothetical protein
MTNTRCLHGLDSRFCAACNRRSPFAASAAAIGTATLAEVLEFLRAADQRATKRAVGDLIGVSPRALADQLGDRAGEDAEANIIASGTELGLRMTAWKARRATK